MMLPLIEKEDVRFDQDEHTKIGLPPGLDSCALSNYIQK
jgi:hypothetical protein